MSSVKNPSAASAPFREPPSTGSQTPRSHPFMQDVAAAIAPVQDMVNKLTSRCSGCARHRRTGIVRFPQGKQNAADDTNRLMMQLEFVSRQVRCSRNRVSSEDDADRRITAWQVDRNNRQTGIDWRFSAADARIKLKRLYPSIEMLSHTTDRGELVITGISRAA